MADWSGLYSDEKWEILNRLMQDSVDVHINMGQDYTGMRNVVFRATAPADRPFDDLNIAKRASEVGMKAIVFTCHVAPGFFRIPLIQQTVNEWAEACGVRPVQVIGSVTLNYPMGGLNPEVVRMCARFGGKVVLMPTISGWQDLHLKGVEGGIELVKNGKVVPELEEIMGIMADNEMVMDISHVDAEQRFILLEEGKKAGINGFYVFNPGPTGNIGATDEQWIDIAKKGCKLMPRYPRQDRLNWFFEKVGVENLVSGTDSNNWHDFIHPIDGFRSYLVSCLNSGKSETDIETVFKVNPAKLLGL